MAGEGENKDKAMASNLKAAGVARRTMSCPVCHNPVMSNARVKTDRTPDPQKRAGKDHSHFDFAGALIGHFNRGCRN